MSRGAAERLGVGVADGGTSQDNARTAGILRLDEYSTGPWAAARAGRRVLLAGHRVRGRGRGAEGGRILGGSTLLLPGGVGWPLLRA